MHNISNMQPLPYHLVQPFSVPATAFSCTESITLSIALHVLPCYALPSIEYTGLWLSTNLHDKLSFCQNMLQIHPYMHSHSFILGFTFTSSIAESLPNLQNHASMLDLCPTRFSSVTSPAIFISSGVMSCKIER